MAAENSEGINYTLKYINIKNRYFKVVFLIVYIHFVYCFSSIFDQINAALNEREREDFFQKHLEKNIPKRFNDSE